MQRTVWHVALLYIPQVLLIETQQENCGSMHYLKLVYIWLDSSAYMWLDSSAYMWLDSSAYNWLDSSAYMWHPWAVLSSK